MVYAVSSTPEVVVKSEVNLPYPGILPGHPMYFIKNLRDKFTIFIVRNPVDRARVLLFHSRKQLAIAMALKEGGDRKTALKTSWEYFKESITTQVDKKEERITLALNQLSTLRERETNFIEPDLVQEKEKVRALILGKILETGK